MTVKHTPVDSNWQSAQTQNQATFLSECTNLLDSSSPAGDLEASARSAARLLKLLASEQRLLILCKLIEQEHSVGELADYIGLSQSATSQHLAKMRAEGLVDTRRDAQTIYYCLQDPAAMRVIKTLTEIYC